MRRLISLLTTTTLVAGLAAFVAPTQAAAHGSMDNPASRVYMCKFVTPDDPKCQEAFQANPQSFYDWMEINIGNADGRHRNLIPDGKLCSANRAKYSYFDKTGTDWPATPLEPDANGNFTMTWTSTAPHSTDYYRVFITNQDYDPNKPLAWSDLDLIHDTGTLPGSATTSMEVPLPDREGRHLIYTIWQRNDSTEAFYSCSDVLMGSAANGETVPDPVATPTVDPDHDHNHEGHEGHEGMESPASSESSSDPQSSESASHDGHDGHDGHMEPPASSGDFIDIT
ncbi:MAG: chitin-binding protein, partial [Micrococcales bacterium]|nr:chitin-binding protein [Micrococcales bacterium]